MSIPASNVRPHSWSAGSVAGTTSIDLSPANNIIFVITEVSLALIGQTDDWSAILVNGGIVQGLAIYTSPAPTAPVFARSQCEVTLEEGDTVEVQTNTAAGTTYWEISGYYWCPAVVND